MGAQRHYSTFTDREPRPETSAVALRLNVYRGMSAAYPELDVNDVLTAPGLEAYAGTSVQCINDLAYVIENNIPPTARGRTLLEDPQLVAGTPPSVESLGGILRGRTSHLVFAFQERTRRGRPSRTPSLLIRPSWALSP